MGDVLEQYVVGRIHELEAVNKRLAEQVSRYENYEIELGEFGLALKSVKDYIALERDSLHYWRMGEKGKGMTVADMERILELDDMSLVVECLDWGTTCGDHILNRKTGAVAKLEYRIGSEVRSYALVEAADDLRLFEIIEKGLSFSYRRFFPEDELEDHAHDIAEDLREDFREWLDELQMIQAHKAQG
ncbi:hypothetical protein EL753P1_00046 [Eggerthella phage EL753P1]|nr:hypothetical protein EL753P1_00046 [Eggerthella phage EL753P1]